MGSSTFIICLKVAVYLLVKMRCYRWDDSFYEEGIKWKWGKWPLKPETIQSEIVNTNTLWYQPGPLEQPLPLFVLLSYRHQQGCAWKWRWVGWLLALGCKAATSPLKMKLWDLWEILEVLFHQLPRIYIILMRGFCMQLIGSGKVVSFHILLVYT